MKKMIKAMSALCMAAVLTGCVGSAPQSDIEPTQSVPDESTADSSDTTEQAQTVQLSDIAAKFEAPDKKAPDLSEAVAKGADGQSISVSELTEDNWMYASTQCVYLAEPQGVSYNSIDNFDIYSEDTFSFSGAPESLTYEYKEYKVGDEVCGLTVTEANTTFLSELFDCYPNYFNGGQVTFEGELTLTGYCSVAAEDDVYISKHDILFVPDADSCILPVMNYPHGSEDSRLFAGALGDFAWQNEYGTVIALGNADEYGELDLSDFPEDGTFIKVKVTVNNIHMRDEWNFTKNTGASIVDIEIIPN